MTTTTLRYNGRAFIYAPTNRVFRDAERDANVYAKEPRMELATADSGWGFHKRAEQLNGRLAMIGVVAATSHDQAHRCRLLPKKCIHQHR